MDRAHDRRQREEPGKREEPFDENEDDDEPDRPRRCRDYAELLDQLTGTDLEHHGRRERHDPGGKPVGRRDESRSITTQHRRGDEQHDRGVDR